MKKCFLITLLFFCMSFVSIEAHAVDQLGSELDEAFVAAAFKGDKLQSSVELLIAKNFPVQMIIEEALKAGFDDESITGALYQSSLSIDTVIMNTLQSHMLSKNVLTSLKKQGLDTEFVLKRLIQNQADMNAILATFQFMLDQDDSKYQAMEMLINAGADRDIILRVAKHFNVPRAIVLEAYRQIYGDFGQFGHVYNRHTMPQPALLAVGVARINNCDACRNRPVISPHRP